MEIDNGIHIFKAGRSLVPVTTREFPSKGLGNDLRRAGFNSPLVGIIQRNLEERARTETPVNATLITTPTFGERLRLIHSDPHPNWLELDLSYAQGRVTEAIMKAVGGVWNRNRMFFDGLVADGRNVGVIDGRGGVVNDEWALICEGDWYRPMSELICDLEATGDYALLVACVDRVSKEPAPLTKGVPFFYLSGNTPRVHIPGRKKPTV